MSSPRELVVLKLGGSVITFKDRPLALRLTLIDRYSRLLARVWSSGYRVVLVLGGGSYGHYYVSTYRGDAPARLVSRTSRIMLRLALAVQEMLEAVGLNPVVYPPHSFCEPRGLKPGCSWSVVERALEEDLLPIIYGDVYPAEGSYGIVSGDELAAEASCSLGAVRLVYATSVDGVLASGKLIERIEGFKGLRLILGYAAGGGGIDVTGGMARKLNALLEAGCEGLTVYIVNGFVPERVEEALKGGRPKGTVVNLG